MTGELPYAPRRKRLLSLWNPLDYLVLLYWVFFFPQALRWYLERFGGLGAAARGFDQVWSDRVYRALIIQAGILTGLVLGVLSLAPLWSTAPGGTFAVLGPAVSAVILAGGSLMSGVIVGAGHVRDPVGGGLAGGVAIGVVTAVTGSLLFFVWLKLFAWSMAMPYPGVDAWLALWSGLAFGGWFAGTFGARGGALLGLGGAVTLAYCVWVGFVIGLVSALNSGMLVGVEAFVSATVATAAGLWRLDAAALALLPAWLQPSKRLAVLIQRVSPLPVPGLATRLAQRLEANWDQGLDECRGLVSFTLQFIPVTRALARVLGVTEAAQLLPRIVRWCDLGPVDWDLMRLQSAGLGAGLRASSWHGFAFRPWRAQARVEVSLRLDTPVRAACAGFWYLHQCEPEPARNIFAGVRALPCGEELYANAAALAVALGCKEFAQIGAWLPPGSGAAELLRPGLAEVFGRLGRCAREAHLVLYSRSPRERSGALNRVIGGLTDLQGNLDDCPQPERVVVERVVRQWLDLALGVASDVGNLEAREPVASPYIVGAPVPADRLVGREPVYDQLRSAWVKPGQRDSLVVYGHRRMGKTSVMRNLLAFCPLGAETGLAFLNLQTVDWSDALADLCQAIAFELWRCAGTDRPAPEAFASNPLAALRSFLAGLNAGPQERRFILVLDEYELLDERLPPEAGTRFVELLRGLTQQYPWLVIALVGLHSLKERSASFYQAIFAWRPVRIGFLDAGGVADCLEVQDDAFPLAYDLEAVAEVHRLTGGQPFLVQLLGDGLVQGFNRRLREEIRPPASRFSAADLAALTATGELFTQGAAYFLGIWGQAGTGAPGQQAVLRALAPAEQGLDAARLADAVGQGEVELTAALKALVEHDVLVQRDGRWVFSVELMRRWVAAGLVDVEPGVGPA